MTRNEDLQKVTLNLRRGDMERIREVYPELGASQVIRRVISKFVDGLDTKPATILELEPDGN